MSQPMSTGGALPWTPQTVPSLTAPNITAVNQAMNHGSRTGSQSYGLPLPPIDPTLPQTPAHASRLTNGRSGGACDDSPRYGQQPDPQTDRAPLRYINTNTPIPAQTPTPPTRGRDDSHDAEIAAAAATLGISQRDILELKGFTSNVFHQKKLKPEQLGELYAMADVSGPMACFCSR